MKVKRRRAKNAAGLCESAAYMNAGLTITNNFTHGEVPILLHHQSTFYHWGNNTL
jgi:hypothetical protein